MGMEPENWHFSYTAAPAGETWEALGSPSLQTWAAVATVRPCGWRREPHDTPSYTAVRAGWQRALFDGGKGDVGWRDVERSLNDRYNAQLDGQNG